MFAYDKNAMDAMAGPARELFEQWISFFPTAPLFGVEWRFAKGAQAFPTDLGPFMPDFKMFTDYASVMPENPWVTPRAAARAVSVEVGETSAAPDVAETATAPAAENNGGSVEQIRGIGPRLAAELAEMGITTVAQIAALSSVELSRIDSRLTSIKGRCFRDDWVGQAKALMAA